MILEAPLSDKQYFIGLRNDIHEVEVVEAERFDGLLHVVDVLIQLSPALATIIAAYISRKPDKRAKINGRVYEFEGYSEEDIAKMLRDLSQKDK